jgi:hypothetical protein
MIDPDEENDDEPRPEELAAYVDGELDLIARLHVERWLACDPEATREVEAQRYFCELWRAMVPRDPTESDWARAALRCANRRASARPRRLFSWEWAVLSRLNRHTAATAALAATLLLALTLGPLPPGPKPAPPAVPIDEFPVLAPGDVEIISLDPADSERLVIGEVPLREPVVPMLPADIHFTSMRPDADGVVPYLHARRGSSLVPMIAPSPRREPPKKKAPQKSGPFTP